MNCRVLSEGKDQYNKFPDIQIIDNDSDTIIGIIEAKKYQADIDFLLINNEQIENYLRLTNNVLVTNFERFVLLDKKTVLADSSIIHNEEETLTLLKQFLTVAPTCVRTPEELIKHIANYAKIMRLHLEAILREETRKGEHADEDDKGEFYLLFTQTFQEQMNLKEWTEAQCANSLTEMVVFYTIFNDKLGSNIPLLEEFVSRFFTIIKDDHYKQLQSITLKIQHLVSNSAPELFDKWINAKYLDDEKNLFTYFYEDFLTAYDPDARKAMGAYYTALPIVRFIIKAVNHILEHDFAFNTNGQQGLAHPDVKLLDFATGTGTFLMEAFTETLALMPDDMAMKQALVSSLLARFYGFELQVTPWVLAKFNLFSLLNGFLTAEQSVPNIYLTDTLQGFDAQRKMGGWTALFNNSQAARKLKQASDIFVIVGNPPYNSDSKNTPEEMTKEEKKRKEYVDSRPKWHEQFAKYKPENEQNAKPINNDYIFFLSFAHQKIVVNGQGVVGVIVPRSFINAPIFRAMRQELMKDFDKIYIVDLHGDSNKGLTAGDEPVFDIKTGVCTCLLIKLPSSHSVEPKPEAQVYFSEMEGARQTKFDWLNQGFANVQWLKLDPVAFDEQLAATRWGGSRFNNLRYLVPAKDGTAHQMIVYGNFWGLTEILKVFNSGITTGHDDLAVSLNKDMAMIKISDLLNLAEAEFRSKYPKKRKPIIDKRDWRYDKAKEDATHHAHGNPYSTLMYRPFDRRIIWDSKQNIGVVTYSRDDVMKHMDMDHNMAITFPRTVDKPPFRHVFVADIRIDKHTIGAQSYLAPLYLLNNHIPLKKKGMQNNLIAEDELPLLQGEDEHKVVNFTATFNKECYLKLHTQWGDVMTPESCFAYIYGVLAAPVYQQKYDYLLAIDFPRVWFTADKALFTDVAEEGQKLINFHTMKNEALTAYLYEPAAKDLLPLRNQLQAIAPEAYASIDKTGKMTFTQSEQSSIHIVLPSELLAYTIGSHGVVSKYLGYRTNETFGSFKEDFLQVITAIHASLQAEHSLNALLKGKLP